MASGKAVPGNRNPRKTHGSGLSRLIENGPADRERNECPTAGEKPGIKWQRGHGPSTTIQVISKAQTQRRHYPGRIQRIPRRSSSVPACNSASLSPVKKSGKMAQNRERDGGAQRTF